MNPAPAKTAPSPRPAGLGRQATLGLAAVVVCAAVALLWPGGGKSFEAPGGFLVDAQGRPAPLAPLLRPVTLLHFWATWCPPCLTEIPSLTRLAEAYRGQPNFQLIAVAVSDRPDKAAKFLGPLGDGVLFDPKWEVAHRYGTRALPETYLVVGGQVEERFVGATDWDDPTLRSRLERLLADSAR